MFICFKLLFLESAINMYNVFKFIMTNLKKNNISDLKLRGIVCVQYIKYNLKKKFRRNGSE